MKNKPSFLKQALKLTLTTAFLASVQMIPATVQADIINLAPHAKVIIKTNLPKHGQKMKAVEKKFGVAKRIHASAGKVTKFHPRITRWDYVGFSVYFENSHVIHSVVHK